MHADVTIFDRRVALLMSDNSNKSHHLPNGRGFRNPWPSYEQYGSFDILYAWWDWNRNVSLPSKETLVDYVVPVDFKKLRSRFGNSHAKLTWLGHATFLLQMKEMTFIFDPIFSERCSPSQSFGPKR
jgi:N-acyl-phosphatidylethanolamine-hydrolysing phospholipase D